MMLRQGDSMSLTRQAGHAGLASVTVGLGWDARMTTGEPFDLDASALVCRADGTVLSDLHFVFYNNPQTPDGTVQHLGDNRTGQGHHDDEQIEVQLLAMRPDVASVAFIVSIHEPQARQQNFGQVRSAYIRVVNDADGQELARFDLSEDASTNTAVLFGEVYRAGSEWKFRAIGAGSGQGLGELARDRGVNV